MTEQLDWQRLARYVRAARGTRSQKEVAENGGPTDTTIGKIETGKWTPTRSVSDTLAKLETGLGWKPGSAEAVLRGEEPQQVGDDLGPAPVLDQTIHFSSEALVRELRWLWEEWRSVAMPIINTQDNDHGRRMRRALIVTSDVVVDLLALSADIPERTALQNEVTKTVEELFHGRFKFQSTADHDLAGAPQPHASTQSGSPQEAPPSGDGPQPWTPPTDWVWPTDDDTGMGPGEDAKDA